MHYSNIVIVENDPTRSVEKAVEQAMEFGRNTWWDFYQIGGRWTGLFDGYDPDTDPNLLEVCDTCRGTGKRADMEVADGCNGCQGKGKRITWPTKWPIRSGDIIPVSALTPEHLEKAYRIICEGYSREFGGEDYFPWNRAESDKCFRRREKPPMEWIQEEFKDHLAVAVDNHD